MLVNIIKKKQILTLKKKINENIPVIIIKNFVNKSICAKIINYCDKISKNTLHRKYSKNKDFYSLDVLPSNVKTNRIFRTFILSNKTQKKYKFINEIIQFQKDKILKLKIKKNFLKFK